MRLGLRLVVDRYILANRRRGIYTTPIAGKRSRPFKSSLVVTIKTVSRFGRESKIPGMPSIRPRSLLSTPETTVREFFDRELDAYSYYGTGKAALRDGLRHSGCTSEGNVLVPAYLPDGVVEPLLELGLEPRYYEVDSDLGPDLSDLEARIDAESRAVMVVHYFGFPQPRFEEVLSLAAERGLLVVDNSAHSPFSRHDSRLLGTFGDVGFTSFRKTLPLPDGALLVGESVPPDASPLAGHAGWSSPANCRHFLRKFLTFVRFRSNQPRRLVDAVLSQAGAPTLGPELTYALSKAPMSSLSWYLTRTIDPGAVVGARREVYRAWLDVFAGWPGVSVIYEPLPDGVCPQAVPLLFDRADDAARFVEAAKSAGIGGVHTWPHLREAVRADPAYGAATNLAARIVTVPCHQQLSPGAVRGRADVVDAALRGSRSGGEPSEGFDSTDAGSVRGPQGPRPGKD
jgi:dTDP-4-amino-4,6-dideoxygalactose transaminase